MSVSELLPETVPGNVERDTQTVDIGEESTVFEVLASDTARRIVAVLEKTPRTASEVATELGISVQNVCYHLDRFQEVGLIEAVGSRYSSKGKEMTVYALVTESLIVRFGDDGE